MRLSDRLQKEKAFLVDKFAARSICDRCRATLDTFVDACSADLDDACPGFLAIDNAKVEFNRDYRSTNKREGGE